MVCVLEVHVVILVWVLWGCSGTERLEIIGNSCPEDSGPADASQQSLELADLGSGTVAVTHRCATLDACAADSDYRVNVELTDSEILLSYDHRGEGCDLSLPSDVYYELRRIPAGTWEVTVGELSGQITVQ